MEAVALNQQQQAVVPITPSDLEVVNHEDASPESCCPDLVQELLSDEHFAVPEHVVDNARSTFNREHPGTNWLDNCHEQFRREHGQVQGVENIADDLVVEDDDDQEEEDDICEFGCCQNELMSSNLGVARKCNNIHQQIRNLLRHSRDLRKKHGFQPDHILLLCFFDTEAEAEFDILLLTRIMFRPFDCTAVELEQDPDDASRASFKLNEHGLLNFLSLQKMIHKYAQMAGDVVMKTTSYQATSLLSLQMDLQGIHVLDGLPVEDAGGNIGDSDSSDSDDDELRKRLDLLRRASGKQKARTKPKAKNQRQQRKSKFEENLKAALSNASDKSKKTKTKTTKPSRNAGGHDCGDEEHPEEPGIAGEAHDSVMLDWLGAVESQQGPIPPPAASSSSSKPVKTEGAKPGPASTASAGAGMEIVSKEHPWRDQKNQCWKFCIEKQKPVHLGGGHSFFRLFLEELTYFPM